MAVANSKAQKLGSRMLLHQLPQVIAESSAGTEQVPLHTTRERSPLSTQTNSVLSG